MIQRGILVLSFLVIGVVSTIGQPVPPGAPAVVITELFYHMPGLSDTLEFIEVTNPSDSSQRSLSGHFFRSGVDFEFPNGLVVEPNEVLIVAKDSVAFESAFGHEAFQWVSGDLDNGGEPLVLARGAGQTVDSVYYKADMIWPEASGNGRSIVLCTDSLDNAVGQNWQQAEDNTGVTVNGMFIFANPGTDCGGWINVSRPEVSAATSIFPNPSKGDFSIRIPNHLSDNYSILLQDLDGKEVFYQKNLSGEKRNISLTGPVPTGCYLLSIESTDHKIFKRLLIMN